MKRNLLNGFIIILTLVMSSCKKENNVVAPGNDTSEQQVLDDFANKLVNPNYEDIQAKANLLIVAVQTLDTATTDANLSAAQTAWYNVRQAWEHCEGFLFGPVEDYNYDPTVDDWPVNRVDLDSLLASNNPLTVSDIDALPTSLKGFHAIEYILFGVGKSRQASQLTAREKTYLVSLTQSLYNTTAELRNSWDPSSTIDFTNQFVNAGNGSQRFATRQDAFIAVVTAMIGICDEVGEEKMNDPLIAQDSTLDESQFSHNSTTDFKNNITGAYDAYLSRYNSEGHGLDNLVAAKNISLDNKIQSEFQTAIASFDNITDDFGKAIFTQKMQIKTTQNDIEQLKATLEGDLTDFIKANIKD
jgi:putative iron-regulated protein